MVSTLTNIVIYADNPRELSYFWSDVFGYPRLDFDGPLKETLLAGGLTVADLASRGLAEDPEKRGPRLFFHHASGPKATRNRIHLDVNAPKDELEAERDRLVGLGATVVRLVDQSWGPWPEHYYQMLDPEGNEFCLQG